MPVQPMPMLSAADLASLRTDAALALPDTAWLIPLVTTDDQAGGQIDTYPEDGIAPTPCRVGPAGGSEAVLAAKLAATSSWMVTLPAGFIVDEKDRIKVLFYATGEMRMLEVLAVKAPRSYQITVRVLCEEVK